MLKAHRPGTRRTWNFGAPAGANPASFEDLHSGCAVISLYRVVRDLAAGIDTIIPGAQLNRSELIALPIWLPLLGPVTAIRTKGPSLL